MGTSAIGLGMQSYQDAANRQFQQSEEQRIAQRDATAGLLMNSLNNPDLKPEDRATLIQQHNALYQPHEAPTLISRLSGLIHGQTSAAAATPTQSSPGAQSAQTGDPSYTPPAGQTNELGAQITPPAAQGQVNELGAQLPPNQPATDETAHPFATTPHPLSQKAHDLIAGLQNHLSGFANPNPVAAPAESTSDLIARTYASPESIKRQDMQRAAENAQTLAQIRVGGSSGEARYLRNFAQENGKDVSDLTQDEYDTALRNYNDAKRRPITKVDPTTGIVNIFREDNDGNLVAAPVRDSDGRFFGGFKPDTVTVADHIFHMIGEDGKYHSVPETTESRKIYGPHAQDKPTMGLKTREPKEGEIAPSAPAPAATQPASPAALANLASTVNSKRTQVAPKASSPPVTPPATPSNDYSGHVIGTARMNSTERGILSADQQVQDSIQNILPALEELKTKNSIGDRLKMEGLWRAYQLGIEPSDPQISSIFRNIALLQIQGAAPWMRLGRNKYTFEVIQKHLPHPTDTPKMMYDKVNWLRDNVIPNSVRATTNPTPSATGGPSTPTPTQQYKPGDPIRLKDGSTATVVGYTPDGKLQVK